MIWIILSEGTYNQFVWQYWTNIIKPKANYLVKYTGTLKINKSTLQSYFPAEWCKTNTIRECTA